MYLFLPYAFSGSHWSAVEGKFEKRCTSFSHTPSVVHIGLLLRVSLKRDVPLSPIRLQWFTLVCTLHFIIFVYGQKRSYLKITQSAFPQNYLHEICGPVYAVERNTDSFASSDTFKWSSSSYRGARFKFVLRGAFLSCHVELNFLWEDCN